MRKTYLDNIRWITVVLVVIYHVMFMFNGVVTFSVIGPFSDNQPQDVYQYIVYPWFMLLLFVVSGMSARFELEKKDAKTFIKDRTRKLLVPSTIGLLVFGWVLGYYSMILAGSLEQMMAVPKPIFFLIMAVSGTGVLWYIQLLWVFSLLLILVRKIEKDRLYNLCEKVNVPILIAFTVLIYGAAQILNTPVIIVYRFGIYGLGFFIGYFVLSHDLVMEKVEKSWILLTALAIVSGIAFVIMYWQQSYADHVVLDTLMCNIYAWLGTLGVMAFMKKWGGFENSLSRWMCKKSWGLYVFHYLPLSISSLYLCGLKSDRAPFYTYLCNTVPGVATLVIYIIVAISTFAGAILLYEVISRIPFVRWCVLGISKKKPKQVEAR